MLCNTLITTSIIFIGSEREIISEKLGLRLKEFDEPIDIELESYIKCELCDGLNELRLLPEEMYNL
jgi:hypothetical protein